MDRPGIQRRGFLMAAAAATSAVAAGGARAQSAPGSVQTDNAPKELGASQCRSPRPRKAPGRSCREEAPISRAKSRP
jgi:hypothetical protein